MIRWLAATLFPSFAACRPCECCAPVTYLRVDSSSALLLDAASGATNTPPSVGVRITNLDDGDDTFAVADTVGDLSGGFALESSAVFATPPACHEFDAVVAFEFQAPADWEIDQAKFNTLEQQVVAARFEESEFELWRGLTFVGEWGGVVY